MVERIRTGIEGLDKALNGGIPAKNLVLVAGGAGTGKSTLCMQYLVNGAKQFKERGLYISTEQSESELKRQAEQYGWNIMELEEKGLLKIIYIDIIKENHFLERTREAIKNFKPKRLVIDSMSTMSDYMAVTDYSKQSWSITSIQNTVIPLFFSEKLMSKKILSALINELKNFDATALLTTELSEDGKELSADGLSEFICDGVIVLKTLSMGDQLNRTVEIKKMRYTQMNGGVHSFDFNEKGMVVE
jgi:circadian clock protein KaiC